MLKEKYMDIGSRQAWIQQGLLHENYVTKDKNAVRVKCNRVFNLAK